MIEIKAIANNLITLRNKEGGNLTLYFEAASQGQNEGGFYVDFTVKREPDSDMGKKEKKKAFGDDIKLFRFYKDPKLGDLIYIKGGKNLNKGPKWIRINNLYLTEA